MGMGWVPPGARRRSRAGGLIAWVVEWLVEHAATAVAVTAGHAVARGRMRRQGGGSVAVEPGR
ncbi:MULTISPECIES: hypothetical protein [unclassified Frankia]|uniref:hypothetical protein n=1 Tax=unclassified Frankia TaxID=2632575 RepID=UPI001EF5734E|nr:MULTISPECIES: hypothetical protein [unclassified Frankia]